MFIAICLGDPVQQFYRLAASLKVIQFAAFYHWATLSGPLNLLSVPPARWALALLLGVLGQARRGSACGVGLRAAWLYPRVLKGSVCDHATKIALQGRTSRFPRPRSGLLNHADTERGHLRSHREEGGATALR